MPDEPLHFGATAGLLDSLGGQQFLPQPVSAGERAQSYLQGHIEAGHSWDDAKEPFLKAFPGTDPEAVRVGYEQGLGLKHAREKFKDAEEKTSAFFLRHSVPWASAVQQQQLGVNYQRAQAAFHAGRATPTDLEDIAAYERLNQIDQSRGLLGKIGVGLSTVPAIVGEAAMAGRVLGTGPALWKVPVQTALMPTFYLPEAQQRAIAQGGRWSDIQNLAPSAAFGAMQVGVLGAIGKAAGTSGPLAERIGRGVGAGVAGQQIVDVVAGTTGLHAGYGVVGDLIEGRAGDALQHLTVQAVTFAAFSLLHGGEQKPIMDAHAEALKAARAQGYSPEGAASLLAPVYKTVTDALDAHQDAARAVDETLQNPIQKELGRKLAEPLRLTYRPPEPQPPPAEPAGAPGRPTAGPDVVQESLAQAGLAPSGRTVTRAGAPATLEDLSPQELAALSQQLTGKKYATVQGLLNALKRSGWNEADARATLEGGLQKPAPETPTAAPEKPPLEQAWQDKLASLKPEERAPYLRRLGFGEPAVRDMLSRLVEPSEIAPGLRQTTPEAPGRPPAPPEAGEPGNEYVPVEGGGHLPRAEAEARGLRVVEPGQEGVGAEVSRIGQPQTPHPELPEWHRQYQRLRGQGLSHDAAQALADAHGEQEWVHSGTKLEGPEFDEFTLNGRKGYRVKPKVYEDNGDIRLGVTDPDGKEVGQVLFRRNPDGSYSAEGLLSTQIKGAARAMYDYMAEAGKKIVPSKARTGEGKAFWQKNAEQAQAGRGRLHGAEAETTAEVPPQPDPAALGRTQREVARAAHYLYDHLTAAGVEEAAAHSLINDIRAGREPDAAGRDALARLSPEGVETHRELARASQMARALEPPRPPAESRPAEFLTHWLHSGSNLAEEAGRTVYTSKTGRRFVIRSGPGRSPGTIHVTAETPDGQDTGAGVTFYQLPDGTWKTDMVFVPEGLRRNQLGRAFYDHFTEHHGVISRSDFQTPEGQAFWGTNPREFRGQTAAQIRATAEAEHRAFLNKTAETPAETGQVPKAPEPAAAAPTVADLTRRLEAGQDVSPEEALAAANLTPREKHVLTERFAGRTHEDIAGDPELAKKGGGKLTRERVRQIERDALKKFGVGRSLEEQGAPLAEQTAAALDKIEDGQRVGLDELHADPEEIAPVLHRRADAHLDAAEAIDELTTRMLQEAEDNGGRLSAERQRYYADEATRLHEQAEAGARRQGPEAAQLRGQPTPGAGQAPVRRAGGGELPRGPAPPEAGPAGTGTPAEPGQTAGPGVELPHEAAPAEAAAAARGQARGDQLAKARAAKTRSVLSVIKGWGGLSEEGARALGLDVEAAKESVPTIFRNSKGGKGTLDLEDLLREAEAQGWIRDAKSPRAGEELFNLLLDRVQAEDAGLEAELKRSEAAYLKEREDAEREAQKAGHSAAAVAEALQSGESAGLEEGADRGRQEEASDAHAEYVEGQAPDTGFEFGANAPGAAAGPEPGAPAPGEPAGPGGRVIGTSQPRPPEIDHIAEIAKDLAESESGALKIPQTAIDHAVRAARYTADAIGRLSGKLVPAITRLSNRAGEAVARWLTSRTYGLAAGEYYADKTLGEKSTEEFDRKVGGTLLEARLRYARDAYLREARQHSADAARQRALGNQAGAAAAARDATEAWRASQDIGSLVGGANSPFGTEADFQNAFNDPDVQAALDRYAQHYVPVKEDAFRRTQGMGDTDPINSKTQLPGLPFRALAVDPAQTPTPGTVVVAGRGNFQNLKLRRNVTAELAKLDADAYEVDLRKIIQRDAADLLTLAAKTEAYRTAQEEGVGHFDEPGLTKEGYTRFPFTNPPEGSRLAGKGPKSWYINDDAASEWRDALDADQVHPSIKVLAALNTIPTVAAVASTVEASTHGYNLLGGLLAPGVLKNAALRPGRFFKTLYDGLFHTPEGRDRLLELARIGAQKPAGLETGSLFSLLRIPKQYAKYDPTFWTGRFLDRISSAMRLTLADAYDELVKGELVPDTETGKRDFINQWLGQYERKGQNGLIRFLRDSKIGPFATAASTMTARAVRVLAGSPGTDTLGWKAELQLRAGQYAKVLAVLGATAALNYALWKRPDGDDQTPLFALKTGQDNGKTQYWDVGPVAGMVRRGTRALPFATYLQESLRGVEKPARTEQHVYDWLESIFHPAMGPGPQFLHTAWTGKNVFGAPIAQQVSTATTPRGQAKAVALGKPLSGQPWENLKAALANMNPIIGALTGSYQRRESTWGERLWRLLGPLSPKEKAAPQKVPR